MESQAAKGAENEERSEPETLPFTAGIQESQERYKGLIEQMQLSKRARSIAVPTNDSMVKARLRELGQPIILFGEQV